MMSLFVLLLLVTVQFLVGRGVLRLFRVVLRPSMHFAVSVIIGVAVFSFVPFLLQLCFVPLTRLSVFGTLAVVAVLGLLPLGRRRRSVLVAAFRFRSRLYEWPFFAVVSLVVFVSAWRCFYYPPTPRDLTSGPEVIAEYAVKERTMVNSVFSLSLESTNNQFKPPFITSLQIIYKMAGFPFGQIWLSTLFIAFVIFLYGAMAQTVHRLIAGMLLLLFLAIPEMYAYTFMALFDYSNAVFFALSLYFVVMYLGNRQRSYLLFSALLMATATYGRSETLVLAGFAAFAITANTFRRKEKPWKSLVLPLVFLAPSVVAYLLSVTLYIQYYLPAKYEVGHLLNNNVLNFAAFYSRFEEMTHELVFSINSFHYYGYAFYFFMAVLCLDAVVHRQWSLPARNFLFAVVIVYAGIAFLGHLFPLMDIDHSSKRAMFKLFPLMLLYMSNSQLLIDISERITEWEETR